MTTPKRGEYQLPPKEGFVLTHFMTVSDVRRSAEFYVRILGGQVVLEGEHTIIEIANSWLILNTGGGPTDGQYLAIVIGPISIISIIVGWFFRNRQRRYLNKYMTLIDVAYETLHQKNNSKEFLLHLQLIRMEITHLFKKGKINDSYYNILQNKISEYMVRVNSQSLSLRNRCVPKANKRLLYESVDSVLKYNLYNVNIDTRVWIKECI